MRRTIAGFTLIEMLVVLLVLGLVAGLAYARFERDPRQILEREARQMAGALEHAALVAQWRNVPLGASISGGVFRFWQRASIDGSDRWILLSDDETLLPHALPSSLAAAVRNYGNRSVDADTVVPLRPSGRNEPYTVEIESDQWRVLLLADPLNRVALAGPMPR